jgi:hypothetical protein
MVTPNFPSYSFWYSIVLFFRKMDWDMDTNEQQQQCNNVEHTEPIIEDTVNENDLNHDQITKGKTARDMDKLAEKWMKNCVKAAS